VAHLQARNFEIAKIALIAKTDSVYLAAGDSVGVGRLACFAIPETARQNKLWVEAKSG
jgi:hypothetical protein